MRASSVHLHGCFASGYSNSLLRRTMIAICRCEAVDRLFWRYGCWRTVLLRRSRGGRRSLSAQGGEAKVGHPDLDDGVLQEIGRVSTVSMTEAKFRRTGKLWTRLTFSSAPVARMPCVG